MKKKIFDKEVLMKMFKGFLIDLPTPSSISYMWNFGSLLGLMLVIQLITGLFLAIHFSGNVSLSFFSVIHMMRDVSWGWLIRFIHSNGASLFFLLLYLHMGRGLYFGSFRKENVWYSGVTIFILSMATAFLGYVLPWGQMSFWAATVITNLLSAIPYVGLMMVEWLWGGFAVGNPTLVRFFSFHFLIPFIIVFMVIIHLVYLHEDGSSNPLGVSSKEDKISFHPLFIMKDIVGVMEMILFLFVLSLMMPYIFMDPENFIRSNPLVTPVHIQPEWYFLFAYTILRSVPSSMGGVVALLLSVMILYLFPLIMKQNQSGVMKKPVGKMIFWMVVSNWCLLVWIGAREVESPYSELGKVVSVMYFFLYFLFWFVVFVQDKIEE